jgi:integrase
MPNGYVLGRYRGGYCAKLFVDGRRKRRLTLGKDQADAERQLRDLNAQFERSALPSGNLTVDQLFGLYVADREAEEKAAVYRMKQCRAVLKPTFGHLMPEQIDKTLCTDYTKARRNTKIGDATIRTELSYLSAALQFAVDMKHIKASDKPRIWRPPQARPRSAVEDYHLTRPQAARLIKEAEQTPHLKLWIILALGTAGRPLHILQLTWDRVDFHRGTINLDDPDQDRTAKGRARVAMNETVRDALLEAKRHASGKCLTSSNLRGRRSRASRVL